MQRVAMKIPWAEPDQLPVNLLDRLNSALSNGVDYMAVGVAARAGCIELTLDIVGETGGQYSTTQRVLLVTFAILLGALYTTECMFWGLHVLGYPPNAPVVCRYGGCQNGGRRKRASAAPYE